MARTPQCSSARIERPGTCSTISLAAAAAVKAIRPRTPRAAARTAPTMLPCVEFATQHRPQAVIGSITRCPRTSASHDTNGTVVEIVDFDCQFETSPARPPQEGALAGSAATADAVRDPVHCNQAASCDRLAARHAGKADVGGQWTATRAAPGSHSVMRSTNEKRRNIHLLRTVRCHLPLSHRAAPARRACRTSRA